MNVEAEFIPKRRSQVDLVVSGLISDIARNRDQDAFQEVYDRLEGRVKGFFISKGATREVAETLTVDVMLSIWFQASSYDPGNLDVRTWVFNITRDRWILHAKEHNRVALDPVEHVGSLL